MRISIIPLAVAAIMLSSVAKADSFNFSSVGTGFSASCVLAASSNGNGSYIINGISGAGITGLVAPAGDFFGDNDNLFFPSAPRLVDVSGFAFTETIAGTSYLVNLFSTVAGYEVFGVDATGTLFLDTPTTFTITKAAAVTPEPSSWALFGSGITAMAAMQMRKRLAV